MRSLRGSWFGGLSVGSSLGACALAAWVALGGCGGSDAQPPSGHGPEKGPGVDRTANSSVSVNESDIAATVAGETIRVSVPVRSIAPAPISGALRLSLVALGDPPAGAVALPYALAPNEGATLEGDLPLPAGVARQADLVRWVVRVDDGVDGGLVVRRSLFLVVPRWEIALDGPAAAVKGAKAAWRARARDAIGRQPIAGQPIDLVVTRSGQETAALSATTGPGGDAVFEIVPAATGPHAIALRARAQGTRAEIPGAFSVSDEAGARVLLTSDKPLYQPGQMVHLRALALAPRVGTPVAGAPFTIEILDGKGTKIAKRDGKTDSYGIASTAFQLGALVNTGTFRLKAQVAGATAEKTVEVGPYVLPKFDAKIQTDKPWYLAGQGLAGVLRADYFFGKPVAGAAVTIDARAPEPGAAKFQTVQGKTGADGRFEFAVKLPASLGGAKIDHGTAVATLEATVTDTAGQVVQKAQGVVMSQSAVDLVVVPEGTSVAPGVPNRLDVFASDPLGGPVAKAGVVIVPWGSGPIAGTTDAFGHAAITWTPPADLGGAPVPVAGTATPAGGEPVKKSFLFPVQTGPEHLVVRTDRAVYASGQTVKVEIATSAPSPRVLVDWRVGLRTVAMRTVQAADGKAAFEAALDESMLGANRIEARIEGDKDVARAGRTLFVRKAGSLGVEVAADKSVYAPGQPAKLTLAVRDEKGQPAVAALGVEIVDEAVFGLVDAQPGLLRSFFEHDSALASPKPQIEGPRADLSGLVFTDTLASDPEKAQAAQERAAAALASLGDTPPAGIAVASWPKTQQETTGVLGQAYQAARSSLGATLAPWAVLADAELRRGGCMPASQASCPGGSYTGALAALLAESAVVADWWGNRWRVLASGGWGLGLRSDGPDEQAGDWDDGQVFLSFQDVGIDPYSKGGGGYGASGPAGEAGPPGPQGSAGAGGGWGVDASAMPNKDGGGFGASGAAGAGGGGGAAGAAGDTNGADEPRVRKDFPETLYVNPALITGPDGKATIDLGMADSITKWRLSALASSASGRLGSGLGGVTVFQDFFVDVDFPAQLTRGDVVSFPIVVYNYLPTPQSVQIQIQPDDWYTPIGSSTMSVDLQTGEVKGVRFPVQVVKAGLRKLVVKAVGPKASDAVARTVDVVPDGKPVSQSWSDGLPPGQVAHTASFPADMVAGSGRLWVDVYPAFLSQVVRGMDSMLQQPYGCFEQTTSTTWPNVLVARYMKQTGQSTPAIEEKAKALISTGYQRLVTYEHHPAGGYSWFGTGQPNVSVTAFGLMEFADMAEVHPVDEAMIARTVSWLAAQQKADGSWAGQQTEFFSFQTSAVRNTAFVVWALASAGYKGPALANGLAHVAANIGASPDAYTLALAANAAVAVAPADALAADLLAKLEATKKTEDGKAMWDASATQTNFYGTGKDAQVAATALAARALVQASAYPDTATKALDWLVAARNPSGNFGSTQATIWTLRALVLAAAKGTAGAVGAVTIEVDGKPAATVALVPSQSDVTTTVDLGASAAPGDHAVKIAFAGTGKPSTNLVARWNVPWAGAQAGASPLALSVAHDKTTVALNETVGTTVEVANVSQVAQNMVLVAVGVPPGFGVVGEDLADEVSSGAVAKFETEPRRLVLYVPKIAAGGKVVVKYGMRATMPVQAEDGGAEAYPYYEPQAKTTAPSKKITAVEK